MLTFLTRARKALLALAGQLVEELLLCLALALVTVALWPWLGMSALIVPGLTLLWICLPSRAPFVAKPPADEPRRKS